MYEALLCSHSLTWVLKSMIFYHRFDHHDYSEYDNSYYDHDSDCYSYYKTHMHIDAV
jgi:hypothetical protein